MTRLRPRGEGKKHDHSAGFIVSPADNRVPSVQRHRTGRVDSAGAEDRLLKRGQLTLPRLLSLAAIAGVVVAAVSLGGVWLTIGYWVITLGFCLLLFLVATDYGVDMEQVYPEQEELEINKSELANTHAATAPKPQLRVKRQAKRRRF